MEDETIEIIVIAMVILILRSLFAFNYFFKLVDPFYPRQEGIDNSATPSPSL
jgi:hypothetical protein